VFIIPINPRSDQRKEWFFQFQKDKENGDITGYADVGGTVHRQDSDKGRR
jgi:hypothetical protein